MANDLQVAVIQHLKADATLTAIVAAARIAPKYDPDGTLPQLVAEVEGVGSTSVLNIANVTLRSLHTAGQHAEAANTHHRIQQLFHDKRLSVGSTQPVTVTMATLVQPASFAPLDDSDAAPYTGVSIYQFAYNPHSS